MTDLVQIPAWLKEKVIDRFNSGVSHIFIPHFNVSDYFAVQDRFIPLQDMLNELCSQREIVCTYQYPSGLNFAKPEMEARFRRIAGLGSRDPLPAGPNQNLQLIDRVLKNEAFPPRQFAFIVPFAESIFPAGVNYTNEEKANIITMLRWANDRNIAARKPIIFLITANIKDVSNQILSSSQGVEQVLIPKPDFAERKLYIDFLIAHNPALKLELTAEEFTHHTQGLSLNQIEDIVLRALSEGTLITTDAVLARKVEILEQEYGQVLEIIRPKYGLDAVGGLNYAVQELQEISQIMKKGLTSAAPMGVILMGPPGTGKSYLAECFARECGLLCVRFKPLREMYVGASERNQDRAFSAIRALSPVVVMVDESDQQQSSRDSGSGGDSGVSERMRAQSFEFWGDQSLRGKVLRIDLTNRVDLIDSAMRRSGRTDVKIPILMPDLESRTQIFGVLVKKHRLKTDIEDFRPYAERTEGFSGSDIELVLTTAYRFASLEANYDGSVVVRNQHLDKALEDFIPTSRDQKAIDRMTLIALNECRSKRLLPPGYEEIKQNILARLGQSPT
ncbi:MAG TPA: ATP-binding protein [Acidobacteriota bacterium]|nr:ATP-binding protein [Acidobacteriota bacterium]